MTFQEIMDMEKAAVDRATEERQAEVAAFQKANWNRTSCKAAWKNFDRKVAAAKDTTRRIIESMERNS